MARAPRSSRRSDRQALASFGTAGIDHGATTACFHANQKTVGSRTSSFRRLVGAFHQNVSVARENHELSLFFHAFSRISMDFNRGQGLQGDLSGKACQCFVISVDKFLIKYAPCAHFVNLSTAASTRCFPFDVLGAFPRFQRCRPSLVAILPGFARPRAARAAVQHLDQAPSGHHF